MPKKKKLSLRSLKTLSERLPSHYREQASEMLNHEFHPSMISMVKNGQRSNEKIMRVLLILAEREDKRRGEIEKSARGEISVSKTHLA